MSEHLLEPDVLENSPLPHRRRNKHAPEEQLVLSELDPAAVIDHLDSPGEPVELITFGTVRETCPNCRTAHLKLVLRQRRVRVAHLFCADCLGCFNAHYANGASALDI